MKQIKNIRIRLVSEIYDSSGTKLTKLTIEKNIDLMYISCESMFVDFEFKDRQRRWMYYIDW